MSEEIKKERNLMFGNMYKELTDYLKKIEQNAMNNEKNNDQIEQFL